MAQHAVCYTATAGYLFQTVLSAVQARAHTSRSSDVYVVFLGDPGSEELRLFGRVCADHGVRLLAAPASAIDGFHPMYARLFLDELLPESIEQVLYLDGDTQVVDDIDALVHADPPAKGALAVRDPMVFIRRADEGFRRKIDGWWDSSGIPADVRDRYVNSGVLRIARDDIRELRADILAMSAGATTRFPDQDAINISLEDRIDVVSMSWNFPGFLLGTQFVELTPPRIIHFMSDPRPWNAALPPWGPERHRPYADLVDRYPDVADYWTRLTGLRKAKYALQQRYKHLTERRTWQSSAAARALQELERDTRDLA